MKQLRIKQAILLFWIALLICCIGYYLSNPTQFSADKIAATIKKHSNYLILTYAAVSILRGFTLLPSTPLIIAGTLLFNSQPLLVLVVSMLGIVLSSTFIYYFSDYMKFAEKIEQQFPSQLQKIKHRLEQPTGLFFVFLWSFFPTVPTDAVCYVAGSIRLSFFKFLGAVFLGELVICTTYIYFGGQLFNLLHN